MTIFRRTARSAALQVLGCALLFLLAPTKSAAQDGESTADPFPFWAGLEVGAGTASPVCADYNETGWRWGTTGNAFAGFNAGRQIRLGMEMSVWVSRGDPFLERKDKITRTHLLLTAAYYPWWRHRFFVKVGGGLSAFHSDVYKFPLKGTDGHDLESYVRSSGFGWLLALGYEFSVWKRFALVPTLSSFYSRHTELSFDTTHPITDHAFLKLLDVNIGFLYHVRE